MGVGGIPGVHPPSELRCEAQSFLELANRLDSGHYAPSPQIIEYNTGLEV